MFDVIVIGARCAGSPLAMLMARKGYRVLLVDRVTFPSPFIATHMVWPPGGAALVRWGLWDEVRAGHPAVCHVSYSNFGFADLRTPWPKTDGVDWTFNMRRVKLDEYLLRAARSAGVEVREGVEVQDLLFDEAGQVIGIKAQEIKTQAGFTERARVVVGADGKHSFVARRVEAAQYDDIGPLTASYLVYIDNLPGDRDVNAVYTLPNFELVLLPTDDGLTVANVALGRGMLEGFRKNVEQSFWSAWDQVPHLAERVRAGRPVSKVLGVIDLPNFFRKAHGRGWVLVGDAGIARDPIRAQGMHNAFLDAERMTQALDDGFSGRVELETALAEYQRQRDEANAFPYKLNVNAAKMEPLEEEGINKLLNKIGGDPLKGAQFRGLYDGSVKPAEFFGPERPQAL